jgi:hypothetical protein
MPDVFRAAGLDLLQRRDGTYELLFGTRPKGTVQGQTPCLTLWRSSSTEGARWTRPEKIGEIELDASVFFSAAEGPTGVVLACFAAERWQPTEGMAFYLNNGRRAVETRWDGTYCYVPAPDLSKGPVSQTCLAAAWWKTRCRLFLLAERQTGAWHKTTNTAGVAAGVGAMAYHPRWGYLLTWTTPKGGFDFPTPMRGPFLIRGPGLPGWLESHAE